jgi:hypothetical protein
MIDLLLQLAYVVLVLAALSFLFCTLPVWGDRTGGRAFAAVTGSSPEETNGHDSDTKRKIS